MLSFTLQAFVFQPGRKCNNELINVKLVSILFQLVTARCMYENGILILQLSVVQLENKVVARYIRAMR